MITITSKTLSLQAEGQYDNNLKIVGNAEITADLVSRISGSIYKDEVYFASFSQESELSIRIQNKDDFNLINIISLAIASFISEIENELQEGGKA